MKLHPFIRTQLLIVLASVLVSSILFITHSVLASPSVAPPNGNPAIPASPQGPAGPQGPQGWGGSQGYQGLQGSQGPQGDIGYAPCNFSGYGDYISYGIDGAGAWYTGISFSCVSGGRTWQFQAWGY